MGVYGASFVRAAPDRATAFRDTCSFLRENNSRRMGASPARYAVEHTVRIHDGSTWISIESAIDNVALQTISGSLRTTAITIYAIDEKMPEFSFRRIEDGQAVRLLEYKAGPERQRQWTQVEGQPESWERLFFDPEEIDLYRQSNPDETNEMCAHDMIKLGLSIPQPCSLSVVAEIVRMLGLPWMPVGDTFPLAAQSEVIAGSPERWNPGLRGPWWKFWAR